MSPGLCIQCASFDSWYVKGVPNRAPNCPKSHAALVLVKSRAKLSQIARRVSFTFIQKKPGQNARP